MIDDTYIFLGLILLIILFEAIAQYHVKKSYATDSYHFLLVGIVAYAVVCLLLRKCYNFNGMGITNFIWSILSIITIMLIGMFAFGEELTKNDLIGLVLCSVGLYFIFVVDHVDEKDKK